MKTILVAEDDVFLANAYRVKLEKEGFTVHISSNGKDALDFIQKNHTDLVVLDLIMPIMDGFTVLKEVKSNPDTKNIPVIIASNLGQKEDIEKSKELGATDYILKSDISIKDLVVKIQSYL